MPTYEYECQKCHHTFERFQSIKDKPLSRCPECRGKLKKLIGSGAGIIFKGSGFYETDYRSSSYKAAEKKERSSDGGASDKASGDKTPKTESGKSDSAKAAAGKTS